MRPASILAIYILFWTLSLFLVLPFGVRTAEEEGVKQSPGHAESAPHRFSLARTALRATIVSAFFFGLFYANYLYGWIDVDALTWARPPGR
jgi:predicted secreted protein